MTDTAAPGVEPSTGGDGPLAAATPLASWAAISGAARAALSMIPTSEAERTRQEPLLRELDRSAAGPVDVVPPVASRSARRLVESTLVGLREPAGVRPYDAELAHRLRQRVLIRVVLTADEVIGMELPPDDEDHLTVAGALRARRLARDLLAHDAT